MSTLSAIARHEYYVELGNALPPPVSGNPEHRENRLKTAIETFEALRPGDAYEGRLAVTIVACGAHALDSLRLAGIYRDDIAKMTRCRAQAASMARVEGAAKRTLEREQKVRLAAEAVAGEAPRQAAKALAPPPAAAVAQVAVPPRAAAKPAAPPPSPPAAAPSPSPEAIAEAEAFVLKDVVAAAQIRHDRGVTPQCKARFSDLALPTDPAVIDALVRGVSDVLTVLDDLCGETLDAVA